MPKAIAYKRNPADDSYTPCAAHEATDLFFEPPYGVTRRMIPVVHGNTTRRGTGCWSWNGSLDKPTLKPSILNDFRPHDTLVDHIFITDGKVIYLSDCSHEARGQTHELNELTAPSPRKDENETA